MHNSLLDKEVSDKQNYNFVHIHLMMLILFEHSPQRGLGKSI